MSLFFTKKSAAWLVCGALALSLGSESARANVLGDIGHSISSLWSQKARKQQAAQSARLRARSQAEQVEFLHQRLQKTQQLLQAASDNYSNYFRQMRQTEAKILDTRERIKDVNDRYEEHRVLFGRRLASMQRHGETNFLQIALGSDSLSDLTRRTAFFHALTERDALLQSQLKADKEEVLQTQNDLMAQWHDRDRQQKEANQERERIASGERQQRQTWDQMNAERLKMVNYAMQQEQASQNINGMIGSLQSRRARILSDYEDQVRRERAQMRAQSAYRSRQRRRVVRYVAPRRYYSTRRYAAAPRYTAPRSYSSTRRYSAPRRYRSASSYPAVTVTARDRGRYRYSSQRSNLARRVGLKYAPRIDVTPQYAPRIELAPMPIESLQKPTG